MNKVINIYEKSIKVRREVTSKSRASKTYRRRTTTSYLEARACESYSTFKHVLWVPQHSGNIR